MLNNLLKKLIKTGAGRTRFALAVVGLSVALLLILSAVQIQMNYNDLLNGKSNQDSIANFLVINKSVTNKTAGATTLSDTEIADLKKQPFVNGFGLLTPCSFKVSAESISDRIPFTTDLFFESVPDEFIDVKTKDWNWDENSQYVPIIASSTLLDMWNFGFASSQGLPQLSPELASSIPVRINIRTPNFTYVSYYAHIVGFSDRISSVLVPQKFMDWANAKFGSAEHAKPSRVIIKTKDPGNPQLTSYLKEHGLTTDADKTRFSRYRQVVDYVVDISWVTGALMFLFALLIFTLFIQLTIASCKEEIALLVTLGAAPRQLQRFLMKQFFPPNIIITLVATLIISLLQWMLMKFLQPQNIYVSAYISLYTLFAGVLILIILWWVNSATIKKYIKQNS